MVGVDVGVQHELEVETKLAHKTHVSLGLIAHYVGQCIAMIKHKKT